MTQVEWASLLITAHRFQHRLATLYAVAQLARLDLGIQTCEFVCNLPYALRDADFMQPLRNAVLKTLNRVFGDLDSVYGSPLLRSLSPKTFVASRACASCVCVPLCVVVAQCAHFFACACYHLLCGTQQVLLQSGDFRARSERVVFSVIDDWIFSDHANRKSIAWACYCQVRWPLLPYDYIMDVILSHPWACSLSKLANMALQYQTASGSTRACVWSFFFFCRGGDGDLCFVFGVCVCATEEMRKQLKDMWTSDKREEEVVENSQHHPVGASNLVSNKAFEAAFPSLSEIDEIAASGMEVESKTDEYVDELGAFFQKGCAVFMSQHQSQLQVGSLYAYGCAMNPLCCTPRTAPVVKNPTFARTFAGVSNLSANFDTDGQGVEQLRSGDRIFGATFFADGYVFRPFVVRFSDYVSVYLSVAWEQMIGLNRENYARPYVEWNVWAQSHATGRPRLVFVLCLFYYYFFFVFVLCPFMALS